MMQQQDIKLSDLVKALQPPEPAPEPPPALELGWCNFCKRYDRGVEGRDEECPSCHRAFYLKKSFQSELEQEYGQALLAVQPLMGGAGTPQPDEPQLFERLDDRLNWSAPVNPMFHGNANNTLMRRATRALRGIAAQHGIRVAGAAETPGREIEVTINGEIWLAWQSDDGGTIRPIRRASKVEDHLAALPADSLERTGGVSCPDCGEEFKSGSQLRFHARSHVGERNATPTPVG